MPKVLPFRGVRPHKDFIQEVMSDQFDKIITDKCPNISDEDAIERGRSMGFDGEIDEKLRHFLKTGICYKELIKKGKLLRDEVENFYLIGMNWQGNWVYGIVGAVPYSAYWNDEVKKHEDTLHANETELVRITEAVDFNFNPIMLTYPKHNGVEKVIQQVTQKVADLDFVSPQGLAQKLWVIAGEEQQKELSQYFGEIPSMYIADGHHRAESGSRIAKIRNENRGYDEEALHNYFIGIHYSSSDLKIYEFNRLISHFGNLSDEAFLRALNKSFNVSEIENAFKPEEKYQFGLYMNKTWFQLNLREPDSNDDPVAALDVSKLRKYLFEDILGIEDLRTSDQISVVDGIYGLEKLVSLVDSGKYKAGITLLPASVQELMDIADAHKTMPPKATCIEPKLKGGIITRLLSK